MKAGFNEFVSKASLAFMLATLTSAPLVAANTPATGQAEWVEEVLVVAARSKRPVQDVTAHIDIIHRQALVETLAVSLADTVRYVPGVSVASAGSRFGDSEIAVRGLSGNRVASLIDGVPVADQFDVGAFANAGQDWLIPDTIARIEILRGPASTLFGSDALGGVVALQSRDAHDYLQGRNIAATVAFNHGGADASNVGNLALAGQAGALSGVVHASFREGHERQSSAASVHDRIDRERAAVMLKTQWDVAPGHVLRMRADSFDENIDSDLVTTLGYGRRYRNTTSLVGDDSRERDALSLVYEFAPDTDWLNDGAMSVYWQQTDITQATYESRGTARTPVDLARRFNFDVEAHGVTLDLQSLWETSGQTLHRIGWGVQWQSSEITELRSGHVYNPATGVTSNVMLGEVLPVRDFPTSDISEVGIYLFDEVKFGRLTLIPAVRYERHTTRAHRDSIFAADNAAIAVVDDQHNQWVPKFGATWKVNDQLSLFAQYARGFRAPPFEDVNIGLDIPLFNYRAIPNPNLKAETSDGFDLGIRIRRESWRLDGSLFYARYDDFIQSRVNVGVDPVSGATLFQSRNIAEAEVSGVELGATWFVNEAWAIEARANYTKGEDRQNHEPLTTIDPMELVTSFTWQPRADVKIAAHGTFVKGQRRLRSTKAQLTTPAGYGVWDITALYEFDGRTKFTLGVFNVADKEHWRWASVRNRAHDDPLVDVLAEPGRHISMGIHRALGG